MRRIDHFIDNWHVPPSSGCYLPNYEPATGQVYSEIAAGTAQDVETAIEAASQAFPAWSRTPAAERSRLLLDIARRIEENLDALARVESTDTGKPIRLARMVDIPRAAANFRFFATAILHTRSESYRTDDLALNYVLRQPLGVVGLISPWNLPLYLFTWKIAPALAAGNTAVAKPSELAPMTAHLLTEICKDAGLPPGVLNVVHGLGADVGAALVRHPLVRAISFTGGTKTGADIARAAAPQFKKLTLELGGKNPNIVFADADLDEAVRGSVRSAFENQGQICLCGSRLFVEERVYDEFVGKLVEATRKLKIGDPLDLATDHGALISAAHRDKVQSFVQTARELGGKVLCGGGEPANLDDRLNGGYFLEPAVIVGLEPDCAVNQEEIFGPVVTVAPFRGEDEGVALANRVRFGLSASLWTRDLARAHRVAENLEAGTVWVNCWLLRDLRTPFGGVKDSGVGREGGDEALHFFTEPKTVCVRYPADVS